MRKIFLLLVGILFVIVLSCERTLIDHFDSGSVGDPGDMKALTEAAHQHYKKDIKKTLEVGFTSVQKRYGAMKSMSRSSSSDKPESIKSYGLWNKAVTAKVGGAVRTEVPLSYSQRVVSLITVTRDSVGELPDHSMLSTIFDRLVIFHNKDGFTQKIVRFHPDRSYLDRHNFDASHNYLHKLDKDFSGYLEYLEVTGERKAIIRVVNGKPVRKYRGLNRQNEGGQKAARKAGGMTVMSGYEECIEVCEDIYGEICVGNPANPDDPGDVVCQDILIGEDCYMDCHWVEEPEPDFCDDPANWEICFGDPDPGESEQWSSDVTLLADPQGDVITDVNEYLKCFNSSQGAKLTVYIDQPKANSSATWSGFPTDPNVGHTFIAIEQGGVNRVLGFYPSGGVNPFTSPSANSILIDDGGHSFDVSISVTITSSQLQQALNEVGSYQGTYHLDNYNCTDFGLSILQSIGINMNSNTGTWPGGGGHNPGNFGQDIRATTFPSNVQKNTQGGTAVSNKGSC